MFPHFLAPLREAQERKGTGMPHRLALVAAAAPADAATPRSPTAALPGALGSPRHQPAAFAPAVLRSPRHQAAALPAPGLGSPRHKAAALPAYRGLGALAAAPPPQRLPHVRHAGDRPAAFTSLEGLRKLAELHKGKHSTVCSYLDTRCGQLVAVKTYFKRTMAKRHYRNVRREIAISRLLAKQR